MDPWRRSLPFVVLLGQVTARARRDQARRAYGGMRFALVPRMLRSASAVRCRSGAQKHAVWMGPGSAAHRFTLRRVRDMRTHFRILAARNARVLRQPEPSKYGGRRESRMRERTRSLVCEGRSRKHTS